MQLHYLDKTTLVLLTRCQRQNTDNVTESLYYLRIPFNANADPLV